MNAVIKILAGVLFLAGCAHRPKVESDFSTRMDSLFHSVPDFSGVVLVADQGLPVYHRAFGFADIATQQKTDTASIFELASVSKQFTATLIAILSEEGKLNYDDPIEKFLPGLPYPGITIRQLLNHTSGLPDYQALMDQKWDKSKVAGNDDIIAYLKKYKPASLFAPGDKYEYSNTGYVLLGSIVEKASGKDFVDFCRARVFRPLAMTSTDIRTKAQKDSIKSFALGYIFVAEKNRYVRADSFPASNYTIWLGARKGPGRISSTSSDLLRWDRALRANRLIKESTWQEMISPARLNDGSQSMYGMGWMLRDDSTSGRIVFHTGDNPGYKTEIIRYAQPDRTVIVLCNNAHAQFDALVRAIEKLMIKKKA